MSTPLAETHATRREWLGLAVLALPALLVSLDLFVMLLAIPHLAVALDASSAEQLWILDIYGFMVAGFLITMGTLGDRLGRRRLLLIGAAAFGAASIVAAYSTSPEMLIAARALLGIAGATLAPSTLSLIMNLFSNPKQRASAIAIWAGCFVVGAIIGPVVGGVMLEHFWWGAVFLLGVPAMILLLIAGPALLPEYRNPDAGRPDPTSIVLSLAAILPIVYGLKEIARSGAGATSYVAIAVGLAAGTAFVRRQRSLADPLLDLRLFANRAFSTTLGSMLAITMLSGGVMVLVAQYLQLVNGLSPLRTGLALVPGMAAAIVTFQVSPLLARRIRPAYLFSGGLLLASSGLLVLTAADARSGSTAAVVGFVMSSIGCGPLVALGTNLLIGSAPPEKAGSAAGVAQTANEFGYALGIAVLGSIATAMYRTDIADMTSGRVPASAVDTLAGATETAAGLPQQAASALLAAARDAYTSGMHVAAVVAAAALAGVAVLIVTTLRHLPTLGTSMEVLSEDESHPSPVPAVEATAMSTSDA